MSCQTRARRPAFGSDNMCCRSRGFTPITLRINTTGVASRHDDSSVDRRSLLKGVAAASAALAVPRLFDPAAAAAPASKGIFGYGVASGDPTGDAVVIWTRATPPPKGKGDPIATPGSGLGAPIPVRWQVSRDSGFTRVVAHGTVMTSAASDHTVKVDVTGLDPYTRYYYRFQSLGEYSETGRTQTAGDVAGETHALRMALVSCSNYTGGYFNAYRTIAERDDLDFVLHVGDYIYEYGNGADRYGPASLAGVRDSQPATETIDLEGYRLRHALHKADADLQAAHRQHPWITIFDDHEVANNAWAAGAGNHQGTEGDYLARRAQAMQAYLEWMPFRLPDQSQSTPAPGHPLLQAVHVRRPRRPVDRRDPAEPQPPGHRARRAVRRLRAGRRQPGHRRRHRPPRPAPARARAAHLDQGRDRRAGPPLAPLRQPGHGLAGALPGRGPRCARLHLRQRRPVGRLHRRPHQPADPRGRPAQRRRRRHRRADRRHPRVLRLRPARRRGSPAARPTRPRASSSSAPASRATASSRSSAARPSSPASRPRSSSRSPARPSARPSSSTRGSATSTASATASRSST